MRAHFIVLISFFLSITYTTSAQGIYEVVKGEIYFNSSSPNEIIKAKSDELQGVLDVSKNLFAFKVVVSTFTGFNSPIQKEHFNENYMETFKYPQATFSGKIIEDIDLSKKGEYVLRAKGKINIHGTEQERIIYTTVKVQEELVSFKSEFSVTLSDHNIKIPRVVHTKLAKEINLLVTGEMMPQK